MIQENLKKIHEQIDEAAQRSGRESREIKLVAVSKRFPAEAINEAAHAGQIFFGENYIQEVQAKRDLVVPAVKFHFIGHLQSNKAKIAASCCDMIETVDSFKLGAELNKQLQKINKTMPVLVQVNIGEDPKKSGSDRDSAQKLVEELNTLPHLQVKGLMTMPPFSEDAEDSRKYFNHLRILAEKFASLHLFGKEAKPEISMGMSNDFQVAIEEGATIIRIGTAIFGTRK